jgi:hypothetical protein
LLLLWKADRVISVFSAPIIIDFLNLIFFIFRDELHLYVLFVFLRNFMTYSTGDIYGELLKLPEKYTSDFVANVSQKWVGLPCRMHTTI